MKIIEEVIIHDNGKWAKKLHWKGILHIFNILKVYLSSSSAILWYLSDLVLTCSSVVFKSTYFLTHIFTREIILDTGNKLYNLHAILVR